MIDEYRRFCFLACAAGQAVTPSDEVDQVWHLHLTYTEDYWQVFCASVLRMALHHGPTRGGDTEGQRYRAQYAQTLASYECYFGPPPLRAWPRTQARFTRPQRFVRIDRQRYWLLPKPDVRRALALAVALLAGLGGAGAAHAQANPLDWTAGPFLMLYLALMVVMAVANRVWRQQLRGAPDPGSAQGLEGSEIAYLAGGPTRVLDAQIAGLLDGGHLAWDEVANKLRVQRQDGLSGLSAQLLRAIAVDGEISTLQRRLQPALEAPRKALVQRRLWLDESARTRAGWSLCLLPGLLVLFGLSKILVGLSRDKPVLFLSLLTLMVAVYAIYQLSKPPTRTRRGDDVLRVLGTRHARLQRAPMTGELTLAVALVGTSALSGTAFGAYHQARQPPSSDSSSSSSSDSGGDGGGSGCGGCGGGD